MVPLFTVGPEWLVKIRWVFQRLLKKQIGGKAFLLK
jgi:hypothetical protein